MNPIPPVSLPALVAEREPTYHPAKVTTPDIKVSVSTTDALARFVADFGLHPAALGDVNATPPAQHVSAETDDDPLMTQAQTLKAESANRERLASDADANHKLDDLPNIFRW